MRRAVRLGLAVVFATGIVGTATPPPTVQLSVKPLSDEMIAHPAVALQLTKTNAGGSTWDKYGGLLVLGVAKLNSTVAPFVYVADLRTGFARTVVTFNDKKTFQYGIDKKGPWQLNGNTLTNYSVAPSAVRTLLYVTEHGYWHPDTEGAAITAKGLDAKLGDRILITPNGGDPVLLLIRPSTGMISAIQYSGGEVDVLSDYRAIEGVLYPYHLAQINSPTSTTLFQAQSVSFTFPEPDITAVTRPQSTTQ